MKEETFTSEAAYQSHLERAWIDDVEALMAFRGQEYFDYLSESLCKLFKADRVYIASFDLELTYGTTIADYHRGELHDNYDFYVPGTHAEPIAKGSELRIQGALAEQFREDESIRKFSSLVARPAHDEHGNVIGFICILFKSRLRWAGAVNSMLDFCMGRISTEMIDFYKARQLNEMNHQLLRELALSNQLKEELSRLAYVDRVTGLPNRERFMEDITLFEDLSQYWLAICGLDCFKPVNESLGMESGDMLLREVGYRFSGLGFKDIALYKWTGDEFLCFGKTSTREDIEQFLKRCDEAFKAPFEINKSQIRVTRSTGVTNLLHHDTVIGGLKAAGVAMQRAKMRGGNRAVFYDLSMDSDDSQFFRVHSLMQEGMNKHEFLPYYQPIYDPSKESYVGFEALMRWMDESGKPVFFPDQFIPIAERSGLIVELGKELIATAIGNLKDWNEQYHHNRDLAINLSPLQFHDDKLVEDIEAIINRYSIDPGLIKFEITESLFVHEGDYVLDKLMDLKALGFRLSLDDFGTGYSSLSYLQKYPFDTIKIDKCFVDDVLESSKSRSLIKAVRLLATDLGMKLVAEGVESEEQANCLSMIGVDFLQGYYFSKPLPATQIHSTYQGTAGGGTTASENSQNLKHFH